MENALWFEHPKYGRRVDVVALPLRNVQGIYITPYEITAAQRNLRSVPSDGLSVIGFPFSRSAGGKLAIWVRGFIASEPEIDIDGLPRFLIDARTREGQSGSPVIAYSPAGGTHVFADGGTSVGGGPIVNLLGVYSGRINRESDLGFVWKTSTIVAILQAKRRGNAGLRDA